nr:hydrolase 2, exosortase A system-associated [Thiospirillum jenense]
MFIAGALGQLFCIHTFPSHAPPQGVILYAHPFGEEMNKSRRQVALQARSFAASGYAVLQCDLSGCGDSAGELTDAEVSRWLDDLQQARAWLAQRWGADQPCVLWGLRLGATLAVLASQCQSPAPRLLLWQPVLDGRQFLNQFLRVKLATDILSGAHERTTVAALWQQWQRGDTIEIGGYLLTARLADSIAALDLSQLTPAAPVIWLDVVAEDATDLTAPRLALVNQWQQQGGAVTAQVVTGPPFWAMQEIAECAALITRSCERLAG